jgi:hypothetical protein
MWQLTNKENGNPWYKNCNFKIRNGSDVICNHQRRMDRFNSLFVVICNEISEFVVKCYIQYIERPLAHIYDSFFQSGIFPTC